jgi:hypothetical protein
VLPRYSLLRGDILLPRVGRPASRRSRWRRKNATWPPRSCGAGTDLRLSRRRRTVPSTLHSRAYPVDDRRCLVSAESPTGVFCYRGSARTPNACHRSACPPARRHSDCRRHYRGSVGDACDNAAAESLMSTIKSEIVRRHAFQVKESGTPRGLQLASRGSTTRTGAIRRSVICRRSSTRQYSRRETGRRVPYCLGRFEGIGSRRCRARCATSSWTSGST